MLVKHEGEADEHVDFLEFGLLLVKSEFKKVANRPPGEIGCFKILSALDFVLVNFDFACQSAACPYTILCLSC
ncbi:hypothetical protein HanPI659440_Chr06g0225171 [Helianthus annuus]|nr:hypothetical protein HanPI659440_Chr06g0225171 [Helianthus annuus]